MAVSYLISNNLRAFGGPELLRAVGLCCGLFGAGFTPASTPTVNNGWIDMASTTRTGALTVDLKSAMSADAFVDTIGVNTHLNWTDTAYARAGLVESELVYLGIDNLRDVIPLDFQAKVYEDFAAKGYDFNFLVQVVDGAPLIDQGVKAAADFLKAHPGSIDAIEAPNEINLWPASLAGKSGLAAGGTIQAHLYQAVNANAALGDVPVVGLSVAYANEKVMGSLGDLSKWADYGNAHIYFPNSLKPQEQWDTILDASRIPTGDKPVVVTETGFYTLSDTTMGVSEEVQAKQILNVLMDAAEDGVEKTYIYQLMDPYSDRNLDPENNWGLFNADGSPKMAATALHNLTTILADNSDVSAKVQGTLQYGIENLPDTAKHMVLTEADGTVDLIIWNEELIWDSATASEKAASAYVSTVTVESTADLSVYDPMVSGTKAIAQTEDGQRISFELSDHPIVIEISDDDGTVVPPAGGSLPVPPKGPPAAPAGHDSSAGPRSLFGAFTARVEQRGASSDGEDHEPASGFISHAVARSVAGADLGLGLEAFDHAAQGLTDIFDDALQGDWLAF
ncbi:hypothetical protein SAMN03080610_02870 [Afifella marina DSM 2698]|uniref:Glycosyl hydrolase catalytic core n=2 Tax=Afifella marina TaxID=1080 RepID=A0A1G5NXQ3_AFIMA|nr:hypothetical protein SAMN03080610_02870 [Afifella marina DSM 2698]